MKKIYIPIVLFIAMGMNTIAQEKSRKELKGDKYAFLYSYDDAIDAYRKANPLSTEGERRLAEAYHKMNRNVESEVSYSKLVSSTGVIPEDYYAYARILKINGKSDESNKAMDQFSALTPNDLRAMDYQANKGNYTTMSTDDNKYKIIYMDVNTDDADFGTSYYKDKIVFSSSREKPKMVKRVDNWTSRAFLDMYVSEMDKAQLKDPQNLNKLLNTKMHDGPASFNKEGDFIAFTTNNYDVLKKDKIVQLEIYFSNSKDGKWSTPEPFALNSKEYSVGHPSLSADGKTMYFSSNMPGGFGGADIYRTSKDGAGTWGKAENMGTKINTEGDEVFPFYESKNNVLLFSSSGRFGLGGLDVFISTLNGTEIVTVVNAGVPVNSLYDDFAAIVNDSLKTGYFSSNRNNADGNDDIYSVDYLKLTVGKRINGFAKDKEGNIVPKTFITLVDDKSKVIDTLTTKDDASYSFAVPADQNFKLIGKKENYDDGYAFANTSSKEPIVNKDVIITKKEEIKKEEIIVPEKIQPGADLAKVLNFDPNTIYFDVDQFSLRKDALPELDKIVKIMNEHPELEIELRSYTDCRASKEYNKVLSDKRAKIPAWYIKTRIDNPKRVIGNGYGETQLVSGCECEGTVVSTCSDAEFQKDRRTEFIITKNNKLITENKK